MTEEPTIRVTHKGKVNMRDFVMKTDGLSEGQKDALLRACRLSASFVPTNIIGLRKKIYQTQIGIGDRNFNILIQNYNNKSLLDRILEKLL